MKLSRSLPFLIDFDGVLKLGNDLAPDAIEFLDFLNESKINFCLLSNSTLNSGKDILNFLKSKNISIQCPAITSIDATISYLKKNYKTASVYVSDKTKKYFEEIKDSTSPEAVVIGDLGNKWTFDILNEIFTKVKNGAELVAMHKNKFWMPDGKNILLDAGAFVNAIEYASDKKAILIGKPSENYFKAGLKNLNMESAGKFLMLGDDLETDIWGAKNCGGIGILIFTGKTSYPLSGNILIRPDFQVHSLKDVINLFD